MHTIFGWLHLIPYHFIGPGYLVYISNYRIVKQQIRCYGYSWSLRIRMKCMVHLSSNLYHTYWKFGKTESNTRRQTRIELGSEFHFWSIFAVIVNAMLMWHIQHDIIILGTLRISCDLSRLVCLVLSTDWRQLNVKRTIWPLSSNFQFKEICHNSKHANKYLGKVWGLPPYQNRYRWQASRLTSMLISALNEIKSHSLCKEL